MQVDLDDNDTESLEMWKLFQTNRLLLCVISLLPGSALLESGATWTWSWSVNLFVAEPARSEWPLGQQYFKVQWWKPQVIESCIHSCALSAWTFVLGVSVQLYPFDYFIPSCPYQLSLGEKTSRSRPSTRLDWDWRHSCPLVAAIIAHKAVAYVLRFNMKFICPAPDWRTSEEQCVALAALYSMASSAYECGMAIIVCIAVDSQWMSATYIWTNQGVVSLPFQRQALASKIWMALTARIQA